MVLPQASEKESFIHHAIVTIGALSKISKEARNFRCQSICRENGDKFAEEYTYALSHYDKALKRMVKAMEAGNQDFRTALLACLLAFCMETLQGRQGPACALAIRGIELLIIGLLITKVTYQRNSLNSTHSSRRNWYMHSLTWIYMYCSFRMTELWLYTSVLLTILIWY
jgi:hypothetical protein